MPRPLEGPRLAPKSGQVRQLVVFLHGYGADGADLLQGNITAPVILSGLDFESFSDDIPTLVEAVRNSSGVSEARKLGMEFAAVAGSRFDKVVKQRDLKIAINGFTHSIVNRKS